MKTERNHPVRDSGLNLSSRQSVSFVISADHRAQMLHALCSDILDWVDQVGLQAEIVLVSRGNHSKTWDTMKHFVKTEANRVRASKCHHGQSARVALGHGERSSRGDLVLAMDSDVGVSLHDVRRVLSSFSARFQVIVGRLSPANSSISKRFKKMTRGFFGKDSWDRVGIWGYRRAFIPHCLIRGDVYRLMHSPASGMEKYCGEIDLQTCEHVTGLSLEMADLLDARSSTEGETALQLIPSSGGGRLLFLLAGLVVLLWGESKEADMLAASCEAIGEGPMVKVNSTPSYQG